MKNLFKKAVSLTIALSTVAAMSVSAFAATVTPVDENDIGVSGNANCDAISVDVTANGYTGVEGATQYAVAIVKDGFVGDGTDDALIYYVNQSDDYEDLLTNMLVKSTTLEGGEVTTTLPDGTYEVRIGNNSSTSTGYESILFTVSSTPQGLEITLNYGDVNGDGDIDVLDASLIFQKAGSVITFFTHSVNGSKIPDTVGDVNDDGDLDVLDASLIFQKAGSVIAGFTSSATGDALKEYTYTYVPTATEE